MAEFLLDRRGHRRLCKHNASDFRRPHPECGARPSVAPPPPCRPPGSRCLGGTRGAASKTPCRKSPLENTISGMTANPVKGLVQVPCTRTQRAGPQSRPHLCASLRRAGRWHPPGLASTACIETHAPDPAATCMKNTRKNLPRRLAVINVPKLLARTRPSRESLNPNQIQTLKRPNPRPPDFPFWQNTFGG